jgi:hypothetical protein
MIRKAFVAEIMPEVQLRVDLGDKQCEGRNDRRLA